MNVDRFEAWLKFKLFPMTTNTSNEFEYYMEEIRRLVKNLEEERIENEKTLIGDDE